MALERFDISTAKENNDMNALVKTEAHALTLREDELLPVLRSSLYPGASDSSIRLVLGYCKAAQLDPMQKPVHIVPMWDSKAGQMRDVVMPGIGLYRTQASRSGQLAGISEPEFGPMVDGEVGGQRINYPEWAKVTVRRALASGLVAEFTAIEYWLENYAVKGGKEKSIAPNAMWTKRPRGQLVKCSEAQALRKAFPELGSMPTADEMEGKTIEAASEIVDNTAPATPVVPAAPITWPEAAFAAQFDRWQKAVHAGLKSVDDIVALARTKGALTSEQEQRIRAIGKPAEAAAPTTPVDDPFVTDMEAAERQQGDQA